MAAGEGRQEGARGGPRSATHSSSRAAVIGTPPRTSRLFRVGLFTFHATLSRELCTCSHRGALRKVWNQGKFAAFPPHPASESTLRRLTLPPSRRRTQGSGSRQATSWSSQRSILQLPIWQRPHLAAVRPATSKWCSSWSSRRHRTCGGLSGMRRGSWGCRCMRCRRGQRRRRRHSGRRRWQRWGRTALWTRDVVSLVSVLVQHRDRSTVCSHLPSRTPSVPARGLAAAETTRPRIERMNAAFILNADWLGWLTVECWNGIEAEW